MDAQMSAADLEEAAFMYRETPVCLLAMLKLGWKALAEDRKELARQWVAEVLNGPPGFAYRDEALTLLSQLTDTSQLQRAVGVLLPLSGRYAAFGKLVQRGMEQARNDFRPAVPVRFLYRDTAGDPAVAAQQVAELAIGERVLAIAGPLVGNAASVAAQRAGREQVPLLTLSQKEGLAGTSPYVFRNSLTAQLQVETLVEYAMGELGMSSFGILHPETRQGQMMADLFGNEVERRGGTLVERQSYLPEQTDFRRQVRLLQGLDPDAPDEEDEPAEETEPGAEDQETEVAEEEEPPPFEVLFLPDYADRISMVAPQLPFYGLEGVQLLGTNGWNDPQLLKTAGKFVEGALFVDGFFRHSPYPFIQEFAEKYFAAYGEDPTILEAQGYDAAGILLTLLNDPRNNSRAGLRWALAQMQIYPGVTGATRFDYMGEAVKTLFLLKIQDGVVVQMN
jgi:ABC-type branched-subunit amino acid transport system substrate-binding protein